MTEPVEKSSNTIWLLRYIVTAETAAIAMMVAFFATGYQDFVTEDELKSLPYPFLPEKAIISKHIVESELAIGKITETLQQLNDRISAEKHAADVRVTILENRLKRSRK